MAQSTSAGAAPWNLVRVACAALCGGQALVTLVLVWRSLAGALTREMSPLAACVVATAAFAVGLGVDLLSPRAWAASPHGRWPIVAAAFVPPLLVAIVVIPGGSVAAIAYATVLATLCAGAVWLVEHERCGSLLPSATELESSADVTRCLSGGDAVQWMSRRKTDRGETIEGGIRLSFGPGQRQEVLHVSFCPPLAGVPEVECEVLDDTPVELRVATAQPYGLRIEARRDARHEALTTEIGFAATSGARRSAAA